MEQQQTKWTIEKILAWVGMFALLGGIGAFTFVYISVNKLLDLSVTMDQRMARMEGNIIPKSEIYIMFELRDEKLRTQAERLQNHEERISKTEERKR